MGKTGRWRPRLIAVRLDDLRDPVLVLNQGQTDLAGFFVQGADTAPDPYRGESGSLMKPRMPDPIGPAPRLGTGGEVAAS
jgi:hypothetical protein